MILAIIFSMLSAANTKLFLILFIKDAYTPWGIFAKVLADYFIYVLLLGLCVYGLFVIYRFFKSYLVKSWDNTPKGMLKALDNCVKDSLCGIWMTTTISLILSYALKEFIQSIYFHARPEFVLNITPIVATKDSASFPSGHTIVMMSISWSVYLFLTKMLDKRYRAIGLILIVLSLLSAICRICVGIHWPFDILGGIILSLIVSYLVVYFYGRVKHI